MVTRSPERHCRSTVSQPHPDAETATLFPFTISDGVPLQPGVRKTSGKRTGLATAKESRTSPVNGYPVSSAIWTVVPPATFAVTLEGAYSAAASPPSGVAIQRLSA